MFQVKTCLSKGVITIPTNDFLVHKNAKEADPGHLVALRSSFAVILMKKKSGVPRKMGERRGRGSRQSSGVGCGFHP